MKTIKLLGLAVVAMLAFGAVGVSSASALLFLTQLNPELFTILNLNNSTKKAVLETSEGTKVECESVLGHGLILNKTDIAHGILFTFHSCESLGTACTSPSEKSGLITTLELDALLVTTLTGLYGILILASGGGNLAFFQCGGGLQNIAVKGNVVGEFPAAKATLEGGVEETKAEFTKGTKAGEPGIKDYWTLQGLAIPKLESTLTGLVNKANLESNEVAVGDIMTLHPLKLCHN
jgi:hypothetical protein